MDTSTNDPRSVGLVQRHYLSFGSAAEPFRLQRGGELPGVTLAYEMYGRLNARRDNAVLIAHALTGDAHAAGVHSPTDRKPGWWDGAIGPGKAIDTDRWFVIASNVIGGCQGSTGPRSLDPRTGRRYNMRFPLVTVRDMVRAQRRLLDHLGVARLRAVIGGSIGGMQALEWAVTYPDRLDQAIVLAATARFHAQGIAYNEIQRRAIMLDPCWRGGEYEDDSAPDEGLAIARMLGMVTYQSDALMAHRFDRRPATRPSAWPAFGDHYDVEGYLHYQGDALVRRFDANAYLYLSRAMDLHDVGHGFSAYEAALARIRARVWLVGITSDILFPDSHIQALANDLVRVGGVVDYWQLDSIHGHDAFLVEFAKMEPLLRRYLETGALSPSGRPAPPEPGGEPALATSGAGLDQHFRFLDGDYEV
ncbi:MAG: homoserine O-acetyltransferase [Chloroflexi bacterium]|nr:homoserine O-acetyltransferase [Chloroflexota bacterium]